MNWITTIVLKPEVDQDIIERKCSNIQEKDPSFKWKIEDDVLKVYSEEYNKAHRRGLWLVNQIKELKEADSGYEIRKE